MDRELREESYGYMEGAIKDIVLKFFGSGEMFIKCRSKFCEHLIGLDQNLGRYYDGQAGLIFANLIGMQINDEIVEQGKVDEFVTQQLGSCADRIGTDINNLTKIVEMDIDTYRETLRKIEPPVDIPYEHRFTYLIPIYYNTIDWYSQQPISQQPATNEDIL